MFIEHTTSKTLTKPIMILENSNSTNPTYSVLNAAVAGGAAGAVPVLRTGNPRVILATALGSACFMGAVEVGEENIYIYVYLSSNIHIV